MPSEIPRIEDMVRFWRALWSEWTRFGTTMAAQRTENRDDDQQLEQGEPSLTRVEFAPSSRIPCKLRASRRLTASAAREPQIAPFSDRVLE